MKLQYGPWAVLNYDCILTAFHRTQYGAKREAAYLIDGVQPDGAGESNRWFKDNQLKYGLRLVRLEVNLHKLDAAAIAFEEQRRSA